MDVHPTSSDRSDLDPRQLLQADLDRARAERDDIERAITGDTERITAIRAALDTMMAAVWRDVFQQQQRAKDRENIAAALRLQWFAGYRFAAFGGLAAAAAGALYTLHEAGVAVTAALYSALAITNYAGMRARCVDQIKKARRSYLGDDGKDVRFVAFTHIEGGLTHPLIGFDGPLANGDLDDRAWKIPGVRDDEALKETFVEIIDERRSNVLLTRFPEKRPTLVHADLENPFVRAFGVFFQRALERHIASVAPQGEEFRQIVLRLGEQKRLAAYVKTIETELQEYDGTHAVMSAVPTSIQVRNKLLRQVVLFRLGDDASRRGMMMFGADDEERKDIAQTLARAAAATFVPISFSSMRIGYVGQGAAQVARTFETARRCRSMIFIEDGERLFSTLGSAGYESMRREILQALLNEWDALDESKDVWIVAGAIDRDAVDPAVLSRFGTLIDLAPDFKPEPTITIDRNSVARELAETPVVLPDTVNERVRILSAMLAHVDTMERQGIAVPRAILVAGPSDRAKAAVVQNLVAQAGLPVLEGAIGTLDAALDEAFAMGSALLVVDVPDEGDPGAVAHLCVTIDRLAMEQAPVFVLGLSGAAAGIDPELRARFGEVLEVPALDALTRRRRFRELLAGKPVDFVLDEQLERFETETDGMSEERLREYVEEAIGRAAMRAIELGEPDRVRVVIEDFESPLPASDSSAPAAT